jgi:hypothetical protein
MAKFKRSELVDLFAALGCETASGWNPSRWQQSLKEVESFHPEDGDFKLSDAHQALYDQIKDCADQDIEVENDMKDAAPAKTPAAAKPKANGKPAPKAAAKGPAKPAPAAKILPFKKAEGPGVIATIGKILGDASSDKPVTKGDILAKLVKAFPDRDSDKMAKTIALQVPNRIGKERGIKVQYDVVTRKNAEGEKFEVRAYWADVVPEGALERRKAAPRTEKPANKPVPAKTPSKPPAKPAAASNGKKAPGTKPAVKTPAKAKAGR